MKDGKYLRFHQAASFWGLLECECLTLGEWGELPECYHLPGSCHIVFDIDEAERFKKEIQPGGSRYGRVEFILGRSFEM